MYSFVASAWASSISYAFGSVIGKVATKHHIPNPLLYNWVWYVLTVVLIFPFAVANGVGMPEHWPSMLHLGISNAVSGTLFVLAFYAVDLSILSPLSNLRAPIAAVIGAVVFGELLGAFEWMLIGVLFAAGLLIQYEEKFSLQTFRKKGIWLAAIWILTSVWFNATIKEASAYNGFWEVSLWSNLLGMLFVTPTAFLFFRDLKTTKIRAYHGLAVSSVLMTAGLLFSIRAFAENIAISTAIISVPLSMVLTVALSYFRPELLEKHSAKVYAVRIVAAMVMFAAALGLSA